MGDCECLLELTNWVCNYSRAYVVLDARHTVYSVKGATAIPLEEGRARTVLSVLGTYNNAARRVSLLPTDTAHDSAPEDVVAAAVINDTGANGTRSPRVVKFADEHEVKLVSPQPDQSFDISEDDGPPSPSSSMASSVQSNTDTVVKTLAERLSFWTRLSKRNSTQGATIDHVLVEHPDIPGQPPALPLDMDSIVKDESKGPEEVIESIVASAAPAPQTIEEKHSELEEKIVRECIREFTRGGMYFAYSFGESSINS